MTMELQREAGFGRHAAPESDPAPSRRNAMIVAALSATVVALVGGFATDVGPWYRSLDKSAINPPDWLFAPGWTVIYALCVAAAVQGWRQLGTSRERAWMLSLFFVNALLNVAWSVVFFTLRRPDWALAEVATLWLSVLSLVVFFSPRVRSAAALLVPYLMWVSFAAYLNYRVVVLNGPFQ